MLCTAALATLVAVASAAAATDTLLVSEIAEGGGNNKFFEIYNHGKAAVSLKGWQIKVSVNGKAPAALDAKIMTAAVALGSIPAGKGIVFCNSRAANSILDKCDIKTSYGGSGSVYVSMNGDDALMLYNPSGTLIDIVGEAEKDPGSCWPVAGDSCGTKDKTLVRKYTVAKGNPNPWSTGCTKCSSGTTKDNSEWIVKAKDFHGCIGSYDAKVRLVLVLLLLLLLLLTLPNTQVRRR